MKKLAYLAFVLLGVIWGTNFLFMKWAAESITPGQIVLLRLLFGFLPILAFALLTRALRWSQLRHAHHFVVMSVLAAAFYYYAYAAGTSLLYSGISGVLSGAIPLFAFLAAWLFLREERINARMLVGLVLGFLGILLIARPWAGAGGEIDLLGVGWMLAGSASLGVSFVYARRFLTPLEIPAAALSSWQTGFALLLLLATIDLQGIDAIGDDGRALIGMVLGLGLLGTGVAFLLYYVIVRQLGALVAASVTYIPPIVALLIGWFIVGEPLQAIDLAAVALILGGVFLLQAGQAARRDQPLQTSSARRTPVADG